MNRARQTLATSPTMVGAITTLVAIVAMFLSYNANTGLPFVPVYRVSVEVPDAARAVRNNEVRIGGHRVGVVESIAAVRDEAPTESAAVGGGAANAAPGSEPSTAARLNLKLDRQVAPLPKDSVFRIRYRSTFGLKYLEVIRGTRGAAPEGFVFDRPENFVEQTEFDDINNTFDAPTRAKVRVNLEGYGNAFTGRGTSLNQTIERAAPLLRDLRPVSSVLADPETRLGRLVRELGDGARIVAPVAAEQAELFTNAAIALAAISRDTEALEETISEGASTLETGIRTLPGQRALARDLATLARALRPAAVELGNTLPSLNDAIAAGTPVLRRTPALSDELAAVLSELEVLVREPTTGLTLERLEELLDRARPLAEHVVPAQTVCNYWNYFFTFIPNALSDQDQVGYNLRNVLIRPPMGNMYGPSPPFPPNTVIIPGEVEAPLAEYSGVPSNGRAGALSEHPGEFRPYELPITHGNPYGPTGQRNADCQSGQIGYLLGSLPAPGQPEFTPIVAKPNLPGSRGPTTLFFDREGKRELRDTRVPSRAPETWGR